MRTSRGGFQQDLHKISTRSSDKDLYEIMQRPFQDFTRSSTKAFHKELEKTLTPTRAHKIVILLQVLEKILQELGARTSQEHPKRAFIEAPLTHGICKIFAQGPLREDLSRISTSSSDKDLHKITQKPLRQDFKDIQKIF